MGIIRFLLAITVVFGHSYGFIFVGGTNAVRIFYMISGFLISYILVEKQAYKTVRDFYISRYLRLYPVYAVVAVLTLGLFIIAKIAGIPIRYFGGISFFGIYKESIGTSLFLVFSNLTLFFQDWAMFLTGDGGSLSFTPDFSKSAVPLWRGLVVPQAWSMGLEMSFYLLAPFVLPNKKRLFLFLAAAILVRIYLVLIGLGMQDPWTYRFFPAELAFFLLGALAHQYLVPAYNKYFTRERLAFLSGRGTWFLVFIMMIYSFLPIPEVVKSAFLFLAVLACLPLTFFYASSHPWDRRIGDLSYPIYISHILVIYLIDFLLDMAGMKAKLLKIVLVVMCTILFSKALKKYVADPFDQWRARYRNPARAGLRAPD